MFNRIPPVVKNIIIINALMLLVAYITGDRDPETLDFMTEKFALFYPTSPFFKPYQFITHMFMHGDYIHLLFNMYAFFLFGTAIEQVWGSKKFFLYYMITGLGAAAFYMFTNWILGINNHYTVGASGAVFGVLLAYGMLFPNNVLQLLLPPIAIKAKWFVIIYGGLELVLALGAPGSPIAHFAHVGGMLFGFILIKYWKKKGHMYW